MRTLKAIDLLEGLKESTPVEVPRTVERHTNTLSGGPSVTGLLTPMGYWFVEAAEPTMGSAHLVTVLKPEEPIARASIPDVSRAARPQRSGHLGSQNHQGKPLISEAGLTLEILPDSALVVISERDWLELAGVVLTTVAQSWRFFAIEARLDIIEHWSRQNLVNRSTIGHLLARRRRRAFRAKERELQRLILNLPRFEGPLTDPTGSFAAAAPTRLYRRLNRALGLDSWRNHIDERVEVLEAAFATAAERQSSRDHILLEILIIAAILCDLAFHAWVTFWWAE
jgi:hypothetical protein